MKAVRRVAEVKVSKSSSAVVRNSSEEVTVVVLTRGPFLPAEVNVFADVDGLALAWAAVEEVVMVVGVATPLEGLEDAVCWRSLPCSEMRAGASLMRALRSWGTRAERTKSLTGCFVDASL